jgi:hypothetical protein
VWPCLITHKYATQRTCVHVCVHIAPVNQVDVVQVQTHIKGVPTGELTSSEAATLIGTPTPTKADDDSAKSNTTTGGGDSGDGDGDDDIDEGLRGEGFGFDSEDLPVDKIRALGAREKAAAALAAKAAATPKRESGELPIKKGAAQLSKERLLQVSVEVNGGGDGGSCRVRVVMEAMVVVVMVTRWWWLWGRSDGCCGG